MPRERKSYPVIGITICDQPAKLMFHPEKEVNISFEHTKINGISYSGSVSLAMDGPIDRPWRYRSAYIRRDDQVFAEPTDKARRRIYDSCYDVLNNGNFSHLMFEANIIGQHNHIVTLESEIEDMKEKIVAKLQDIQDIENDIVQSVKGR